MEILTLLSQEMCHMTHVSSIQKGISCSFFEFLQTFSFVRV